MAWPNFRDPANRSRSSQCSVIRSVLSRRVSSGPVRGKDFSTSARGPARYRVILPRSRIRGESCIPSRSNSPKLTRVTPSGRTFRDAATSLRLPGSNNGGTVLAARLRDDLVEALDAAGWPVTIERHPQFHALHVYAGPASVHVRRDADPPFDAVSELSPEVQCTAHEDFPRRCWRPDLRECRTGSTGRRR